MLTLHIHAIERQGKSVGVQCLAGRLGRVGNPDRLGKRASFSRHFWSLSCGSPGLLSWLFERLWKKLSDCGTAS